MNKEEAIKIVRSHYPANKQMLNEALEFLIPELKESTDERIKKWIRKELESKYVVDNIVNNKMANKALAWLEKQGDKDKLIQELGKYKVKYTQEVLEKHINSMSNKDDERLRKTTIAFLKDFAKQGYENAVECIDWLEKQGQTFTKKDVEIAYLKGVNDTKHELEKQGEQKSAERKDFISIPFGAYDSELVNETITIPDGCVATIDGNKIHIKREDKSATEAIKLNHTVDNNEMVESTFNAGDWVVRKDGETFRNGSKFAQIQSIELDGEMCYLDTGRWLYPSEIRPWTIADAKDGDVLATEDWVFIFEKMNYNGKPVCHCHYDIELGLCIDINTQIATGSEIHPATKEQRDLCFQKMKEAGYAFDFEKKELKKIRERDETN